MIISFSKGKLPAGINGKYNFVDVRDVCSATINAAFSSISQECFLLTGKEISVSEFFDMLHSITGKAKPRFNSPYYIALIIAPVFELISKISKEPPMFTYYSVKTLHSNCSFDNSKAKETIALHIRPVKETINDTYAWFRDKGYL